MLFAACAVAARAVDARAAAVCVVAIRAATGLAVSPPSSVPNPLVFHHSLLLHHSLSPFQVKSQRTFLDPETISEAPMPPMPSIAILEDLTERLELSETLRKEANRKLQEAERLRLEAEQSKVHAAGYTL